MYPRHWGRYTIVTFGARWLDFNLMREFDRYHGRSITTDRLREALEKQEYRPDLVLDGMRKFDDPETRDPALKNHTGYHKRILEGIVLSQEFVNFVQDHKHRILEPARLSAYYAATRYETTRRIFIWCRSGRHRSVALTVLLKACFKVEGHDVQVIHLQKSWQYLCKGPQGGCEDCKDCNEDCTEDCKNCGWTPRRVAQVV